MLVQAPPPLLPLPHRLLGDNTLLVALYHILQYSQVCLQMFEHSDIY